jgi:hypothetical protein
MLLFRFEKNGKGWQITDPNNNQLQHITCEGREKGWDYVRREISKRTRNATAFTLTVELQDTGK